MTILSHGAECLFSGKQATQCAVTGLGRKTLSRIFWTTCCFFPYLKLYCYHHQSHMELYIILSEASVTHLAVEEAAIL